jgi:hypothetical protein
MHIGKGKWIQWVLVPVYTGISRKCIYTGTKKQDLYLCTWLWSEMYHKNKTIYFVWYKTIYFVPKTKFVYLALVRRVPRRRVKGGVVAGKEEGGGRVLRHVG